MSDIRDRRACRRQPLPDEGRRFQIAIVFDRFSEPTQDGGYASLTEV